MIKVTVNNEKIIDAEYGDNLYGLLTNSGYEFAGCCGGMGRCLKCRVSVDGTLTKSCEYTVTGDIDVTTGASPSPGCTGASPSDGSQSTGGTGESPSDGSPSPGGTGASGRMATVMPVCRDDSKDNCDNESMVYDNNPAYMVAVDIGTTTIAMELLSVGYNGEYEIISSYGALNPQAKYGADVIARIKHAETPEGLNEMSELLYDALKTGIEHFCNNSLIRHNQIRDIALFGNTAMLYIASGITTEGLGTYPFYVKEEMKNVRLRADVIDDRLDADVYIPPVISAFAGADITGGACALSMDRDDSYNMLIDLGTNGEIIVSNGSMGICLSTACGPAFEEAFKKQGVYGSNICDMLALLVKRKQIDKTGVIVPEFFETGVNMGQGIIIDMDCVRSFQLAKAAIACGIEKAIIKSGISYRDINRVYVAGGFGFYLNPESAIVLGMFPKEFEGRFVTVGNTSLLAAEKALTEKTFKSRLKAYAENIQSVNLADEPDFNVRYIEHINF